MGHLILKSLSFFLVMRVLMHLWQKVCPHMVSNLGGLVWLYCSLQEGQLRSAIFMSY